MYIIGASERETRDDAHGKKTHTHKTNQEHHKIFGFRCHLEIAIVN